MAYLDKSGIARVAPRIQEYNDDIEKVIRSLDGIKNELSNVFNQMPDDRWKKDEKLLESIQHCQYLIEQCKVCCHLYFMVG